MKHWLAGLPLVRLSLIELPLAVLISLSVLLFPTANALADTILQRVGTLDCKTIPHSGLNLLIHSTKGVRCTFTPSGNGPIEHYKGETGIAFGVDVNLNHSDSTSYSVLAKHFKAGMHQLAGKYEGAAAGGSFGLSIGDSAPISKTDHSISLQPVNVKTGGIGVAAGFSYLHLAADRQ